MPHLLQQQTAPADAPSSADVAAQVRAQVAQQLQAAGATQQAAKKAADDATDNVVTVTTKNGKTVTIHTPVIPRIPMIPPTPLAPLTQLPSGTTSIPFDPPLDIPRRVENLGYAFFLMIAVIAIGKPLARALGSIIERRSLKPAMPAEFGARLERIEQGIEAVSIEVERISESQRYLLKVQAPTPERVEIPRSVR